MLRLGRRIAKAIGQTDNVEVAEMDGVRALYLGSDTIQSAMRISQPDALELTYARAMMLFLMFAKAPKNVLILGLGGGSLAKYLYRFMPHMHTTVLEINPHVIEVARQHFYLPENDERLQVIEGDGIAYVREQASQFDVLMLDAYDRHGVAPEMVSQDFFDCCAQALTAQGVLMVNLWGSDRHFDIYHQRIRQSFAGRSVMLRTGRPGNIIVMGFAQMPTELRWASLRERAKTLEQQYDIEFLAFTERLRDDNPCSEHRLFLGESQ